MIWSIEILTIVRYSKLTGCCHIDVVGSIDILAAIRYFK